jgi:hypothetical protein
MRSTALQSGNGIDWSRADQRGVGHGYADLAIDGGGRNLVHVRHRVQHRLRIRRGPTEWHFRFPTINGAA